MKHLAICKGLLVLACIALTAAAGYASPINVLNPSFEEPLGTLELQCGLGCSYDLGTPSGWDGTGLVGRWQPGSSAGYFEYYDYVPDGITVLYTMGGSVSQTVGTVEEGYVYTLKVDWGHRSHGPFDAESVIALNIGGTNVYATGVTPELGQWSTFTASYTGTAEDAGKSLSIFLSSGDQGNFDNVRLDEIGGHDEEINIEAVTPPADVPEVPSFALVGMGLAGLALIRRIVPASARQQ
jgi:hypothetical protein